MKHRRKAAAFIAAILISASLLLSGEGVFASSSAAESELAMLEDKLSQASAARSKAQKAVDAAKAEKAGAVAAKKVIDGKIFALTGEIDIMTELVAGLEWQLTEKNEEIAAQERKVDDVLRAIGGRMRIMREDGGFDLLAVLMDTEGLVEFFTELDRFTCMMDYDKQLMNSYNDAIAKLNLARDELDSRKTELEAQLIELEARKLELESDLAAANRLVSDAERDVNAAAKNLADVEAEERKYNDEREAKLAELQRSTNQLYVGGDMLWPLPVKYTTVTSPFGYRIHPVTGKPQFHSGIDIHAPYGTEIYAVNNGTVIEVSYNYADGYYVTVSHGGGVASFYSHVSKYAVKVGDKVKRGQVIAYVGSSGYTTGAHLNLNMYENNVAVDPMKYYE